MPLQTLTVNGNSVVAVPIPNVSAAKMLEFSMSDGVALVPGAYTKDTQAFVWPGADEWSVKLTLAPIVTTQRGPWSAWLMQMRGMLRATLISDPSYTGATGRLGGSAPVIDSSVSGNNLASATRLFVRGLAANTAGVFQPGDQIQIGYRLHTFLDELSSDGTGKGSAEIWPSLREPPADGSAIITANPQGLFRLANNTRGYSSDISRTTQISFQLVEYRGNGNS